MNMYKFILLRIVKFQSLWPLEKIVFPPAERGSMHGLTIYRYRTILFAAYINVHYV